MSANANEAKSGALQLSPWFLLCMVIAVVAGLVYGADAARHTLVGIACVLYIARVFTKGGEPRLVGPRPAMTK
jgi:hypothetical protein